MRNAPFEVHPIAGALGAELRGVDLAGDLPDATIGAIRGFQQKGDYKRIQVLELLFVKGWPNWQVAEFVGVSEQQVANYRFAAVKKLSELIRAAGLSADVFPELQAAREE